MREKEKRRREEERKGGWEGEGEREREKSNQVTFIHLIPIKFRNHKIQIFALSEFYRRKNFLFSFHLYSINNYKNL